VGCGLPALTKQPVCVSVQIGRGMGGVREPPHQVPHFGAVLTLVVLVSYLVWLYVVGEFGSVMAMGGRIIIDLAYYSLWVWAVLYALNRFLLVALEQLHEER
jgi:hypothetical protein